MNKPTEYCSFVSVDYIICDCGETFPNEDALKDHLDSDHANSKPENKPTSLYDNFIEKRNVKKEFKEEGSDVTNEYYLENAPECESETDIYAPVNIKKEEITLQYVDDCDSYIVQEGDDIAFNEVVIKEEPIVPNPLGCKRVTFKASQLDNELVILDQENEEHDYDRGTKTACQEYYFCDVCGKSFTTERSVHTHIRMMHHVGDEPRHKTIKHSACDVCGKKYAMWQRICSGCGAKRPAGRPNQRALDKQKQNLGRFTCDVCGVGRSSNAALRYHQRIHTGEKPYQCTLCPKAFTMPLFLQLHTRTHTGERPYQCPVCPKAFSNQAALVRHNRVHSGEKPYACPECCRQFSQSNNVKVHYNTVHLRMPPPPRRPRNRKSAPHRPANV